MDYKNVKDKFESKNYKLLTKENEYKGVSKTIFNFICPNGHRYHVRWYEFIKEDYECHICKKLRGKTQYKTIYNSFLNEGYKLIYPTEEEYPYFKIKTEKIKYICPQGHNGSILWQNWRKGRRCFRCSNKQKVIPYTEVKKNFDERGYKLITNEDEYDAAYKTKLEYICPNGHAHKIKFQDFKSGHGCPYCTNQNMITIDHVKREFESEDYIVLSKNIKNSKTKIKFICPRGHIHYIRWNDWQQGIRCGECNNKISRDEKEIYRYIVSLGLKASTNNRKIIYPKELDIVIPEKKIAIEYCGLYWHGDDKKDKNYHINKLRLCNKEGYRLITIFEDEWINKQEIVKSRLKYILGLETNKIYARKCKIVEIDTKSAKDFINKYHIQGYQGSNIKFAAIYKDEIVSVMTFSRPNIAKGMKNFNENIWELNRFCSSCNIPGIQSRCLKHFIEKYRPKSIYSFSDRRWNDGKSYEKIGFKKIGPTKPNYWYYRNNEMVRYHRFNFRKDKIKNLGEGTEFDIMSKNGWKRIWDCGSDKFVMNLY